MKIDGCLTMIIRLRKAPNLGLAIVLWSWLLVVDRLSLSVQSLSLTQINTQSVSSGALQQVENMENLTQTIIVQQPGGQMYQISGVNLNKILSGINANYSISNVNSTNLYEPRIELRYQSPHGQPFVSLDESAFNNTVVAAVVVYDDDIELKDRETRLSIEGGNELNHFRLISTPYSHTIRVTGAPLSRSRAPEYNLTIVARDNGTPPRSSSTNLVIKLYTSSPPAATGLSSKPPVNDLILIGIMLVIVFCILVALIITFCNFTQRSKNKKASTVPKRPTSAANHRIHPRDPQRFVDISYLNA